MSVRKPKKTICSGKQTNSVHDLESVTKSSSKNWNKRNDSSNISQILAPNLSQQSGDLKILPPLSPPPEENEEEVGKHYMLFSNKPKLRYGKRRIPCSFCYCCESPQPPALNLNPPSPLNTKKHYRYPKIKHGNKHCCRILDGSSDSDDGGDTFRSNYSKEILDRAHSINYQPESTFLKRLTDESHANCNCSSGGDGLKYTQTRSAYEHIHADSQVNTLPEPPPPKDKGTEAPFCPEYGQDNTTLTELSDFRKSNYFETHSTQIQPEKNIPDHKCIHKFTLNERLMPIPVNTDVYGTSRCIVCNKPMHNNKLVQKNNTDSPKGKKMGAVGRIPIFKEFSTTPNKINIGGGNEIIEIKVPMSLRSNQNPSLLGADLNLNFKKPVPTNTLALRFQKGVA